MASGSLWGACWQMALGGDHDRPLSVLAVLAASAQDAVHQAARWHARACALLRGDVRPGSGTDPEAPADRASPRRKCLLGKALMSVARCTRCGHHWNGMAECHCPTCHRHFGNIHAFDRHRRNDTCLDPATVERKHGGPAFERRERASGPVWLQWHATPRPWPEKSAATNSGVA